MAGAGPQWTSTTYGNAAVGCELRAVLVWVALVSPLRANGRPQSCFNKSRSWFEIGNRRVNRMLSLRSLKMTPACASTSHSPLWGRSLRGDRLGFLWTSRHVALACRVRAAGDLVMIRRQSVRTDRERLPSSPIVGWEQKQHRDCGRLFEFARKTAKTSVESCRGDPWCGSPSRSGGGASNAPEVLPPLYNLALTEHSTT